MGQAFTNRSSKVSAYFGRWKYLHQPRTLANIAATVLAMPLVLSRHLLPAFAVPLTASAPTSSSPLIHHIAVFEPDERRLIAERYPALRKQIGLLVHTKTHSMCTAFCVAPDIIATAGHCVAGTVSHPAGNPADLLFRPDALTGSAIPVRGRLTGTTASNILTGATRLNTRPPINATSDWGLLRLERIACPHGGLPLSRKIAPAVAAEAAAGRVYHIAYHRDLVHWKLAVGTHCSFVSRRKAGTLAELSKDFERAEDLLLHTCDTESASSGSPLLVDGDNGPEVVGINVGTYVRSRVITHEGRIVQRLDQEVISNTALLAAPLISWLEAFASSKPLTKARDIERLQEFLAAQGLEPGPLDGRIGPRTRKAIEGYEARLGLPITGLATQNLLKRLETTTSATAQP